MDNALIQLKKADPAIKNLIAVHPEPSLLSHKKYYEELVSSIISQQLSVKAAATIESRLKNLFDEQLPTPHEILEKDTEELRTAGLSRPKIGYMKDLAEKVIDGTVEFDTIEEQSNEAIIQTLTQVKGIGEWTAHMFLMFCMGRLDVLPHGDLGIRNGVTKLYGLTATATAEDVKNIAIKNNWHPYESVASYYVWQSLGNSPK